MRHIENNLDRTHTFIVGFDEVAQIAKWEHDDFLEPSINSVRDYMREHVDIFFKPSLLSQARRRRAENHRKRFGTIMPLPLPPAYIIRKGMLTHEERMRLMNCKPGDVIEVENIPTAEDFHSFTPRNPR